MVLKLKTLSFTFTLCAFILASYGLGAQEVVDWSFSIGGRIDDYAESVKQTSDGGFIVVGSTNSDSGDFAGNDYYDDYFALKLNAEGELQWKNTYGGSSWDFAYSVVETATGNFVIVGKSYSQDGDVSDTSAGVDIWLAHISSTGTLIEEKSLGGSGEDIGHQIINTDDGGFVIAGSTRSLDGDLSSNNGKKDVLIMKLDENMNVQWAKNYGGSNNDVAHAVKQIDNEGYILAGVTTSNDFDVSSYNGEDDIWVIKLDSLGELIWEKNYGGTDDDVAYDIEANTEGHFYVVGSTRSNDLDVTDTLGGDAVYWMIKIDENGNLLWDKTYMNYGFDEAKCIEKINDNEFVISGDGAGINYGGNNFLGYGGNDFWLIGVDGSGEILWYQNYGGSNTDIINDMIITQDHSVVMVGYSRSDDYDVTENFADDDVLVLKLESSVQVGVYNQQPKHILEVNPNPCSVFFNINPLSIEAENILIISDIRGKQVRVQKNIGPQVNVSDLAPGIYMLELLNQEEIFTQKLVVQ